MPTARIYARTAQAARNKFRRERLSKAKGAISRVRRVSPPSKTGRRGLGRPAKKLYTITYRKYKRPFRSLPSRR